MHQLNKYSWALVLVYLTAIFLMDQHSNAVPGEAFYITAPLIGVIVFWSKKVNRLFHENRCKLTKTQRFHYDLFLVNLSFLFALLLTCLFEYHNTDLRGWWPLALYFYALYGFFFAFIFALAALMLDKHKNYTFAFSILIALLIPLLGFLSYTMPFSIFGKTEAFYVITGIIMGIHLLLCLGYRWVLGRCGK